MPDNTVCAVGPCNDPGGTIAAAAQADNHRGVAQTPCRIRISPGVANQGSGGGTVDAGPYALQVRVASPASPARYKQEVVIMH